MLAIRSRPWPAPQWAPRMGNDEDVRPGLSLTSRFLRRDGQPWIPISGELHYSRVPRERWDQRLRLMRSGGITVVSSYVPWIHHVPRRGAPRFEGNLDVAAFVDLCRATGMEVVLRIGPWVHGELRNGGFPDWVQQAPLVHRSDDPAYLELVGEWFGQLGAALAGRCTPANVLAIQLDNELYDQPGHLLTLKRLAREAGMSAPLWTATAWGGAQLPAEQIMPLYGGYGDGFWVDADAPWDPSFREHFFFSHTWDDPGIGADLRTETASTHEVSELFPPATCELGGGMATAYHRRPRPSALDIAAVAHCKIGNGSAWQGYYMYSGGTNPPGTQESHATGYPNDMPELSYDFHAPIGEAGALSPTHAGLRRQHAFLAAFGSRLADMPSSLPQVRPEGVDDTTTLRWALRSDGGSGFLFLAWHQPHVTLPTYQGAQFQVTLETEQFLLPSKPVDIPAGTLARWPIALDVQGVRIDWATASALTLLPGPVPTVVLCAEPGIPVELAVAGQAPQAVQPGREPLRLSDGSRVLDVLVLSATDADAAWVEGGRRLLLSDDDLAWGADGRVTARTTRPAPDVRVYDPVRREFRPLPLQGDAPAAADVPVTLHRPAHHAVPAIYGKRDTRQSAPSTAAFDELAAICELQLPAWAADPDRDALLRIDWAGDVAQLRVDGRTVTDRFWDGSAWLVSLRDADYRPTSTLTLHVLPLSADSPVHLPADAAERAAGSRGQLLAIDAVRVEAQRTWREPTPRPRPAPRGPTRPRCAASSTSTCPDPASTGTSTATSPSTSAAASTAGSSSARTPPSPTRAASGSTSCRRCEPSPSRTCAGPAAASPTSTTGATGSARARNARGWSTATGATSWRTTASAPTSSWRCANCSAPSRTSRSTSAAAASARQASGRSTSPAATTARWRRCAA
ncbi:beta-galactosidase [Phytohabitans rumicis]|uniref:Beta-galactosidase n=1 Tax=Phytohabitans rumicis TaxID=1076125 RepID=A0A6V8KPE7_9ACTN|nr:beta-galactosidase [Phytohabitans rumicis]